MQFNHNHELQYIYGWFIINKCVKLDLEGVKSINLSIKKQTEENISIACIICCTCMLDQYRVIGIMYFPMI